MARAAVILPQVITLHIQTVTAAPARTLHAYIYNVHITYICMMYDVCTVNHHVPRKTVSGMEHEERKGREGKGREGGEEGAVNVLN